MTRPPLYPLLLALLLTGAAPAAAPVYDAALEGRVFDRAWSLVRDKYWNRAETGQAWDAARATFRSRAVAAPDRRAFYTILGEMLATLDDSHVYAIDPIQLAIGAARDDGEDAQGFGFTMLPNDDGEWRVMRVQPGSAAATAGVQIGWIVSQVNGGEVDIDYQPKAGEAARFVFRDEFGADHRLTLPATLEQPEASRRAELLPGNILLVGLNGFDSGDDRWIAREIARAQPQGLILDLRDNGGGEAGVIARVAGLFFSENRPLVQRIGRTTSIQKTSGAGADAYRGPLAVLVGNGSASGAEAVAALIGESGRGITVGERTAGALTGAAYYRLPDSGQLTVAEFDIRTPAGHRLEGVGLRPLAEVRPTLAEQRAGKDVVLDRARALLTKPASSRRSPGSN
ncbi:S41 family peptidase [uncultured Sphingomonas sp.]|uniref:S41 family peptidase n=1 Tax=uncultured Sphingomonas sp. TaxID=158754 RepID=UPI0025E59CC7|nr:S41 family peptidase [uncultured Sphingomonas sp.]